MVINIRKSSFPAMDTSTGCHVWVHFDLEGLKSESLSCCVSVHDRDGLERIVRRCGWVEHPTQACYTVRNMAHSEINCQCFVDACNSSVKPQYTLWFVFLPALVALIKPSIFWRMISFNRIYEGSPWKMKRTLQTILLYYLFILKVIYWINWTRVIYSVILNYMFVW